MNGCALTPFDSIKNFCPWQRPHVAGMLTWLTGELGWPGARISCAGPWQSTQRAAAGAAAAGAAPAGLAWMLCEYASCTAAWQSAQATFAGGFWCARLV